MRDRPAQSSSALGALSSGVLHHIKQTIKPWVPASIRYMVRRARSERSFDEVDIAVRVWDRCGGPRQMIDVGAHHGGALEPFAHRGFHVVAFEPDPANRAELLRKVAPLGRAITVDPRAVSSEVQRDVPFFRSHVSSGISGLSAFHPSHEHGGVVDTTTIAEVVRDRFIDDVWLLKVDTEGHDLFVLRGVPWDSLRPHVIVCEFEDRKTVPLGYNTKDLVAYLRDRGYSIVVSEWFPVVEYGESHRWRRLCGPDERLDERGWGNLIAARDPQLGAVVADEAQRYAARYRAATM